MPQVVAQLDDSNDRSNTTAAVQSLANDPRYFYQAGGDGIPGVDFPVFSHIPKTTFSCKDMEEGYYADTDTDCQVFHICNEGRKLSFLCPNGTIFQQTSLICDWWFKVNCTTSPFLYEESAEVLQRENARRKESRRHHGTKHGIFSTGEETVTRHKPYKVTPSFLVASSYPYKQLDKTISTNTEGTFKRTLTTRFVQNSYTQPNKLKITTKTLDTFRTTLGEKKNNVEKSLINEQYTGISDKSPEQIVTKFFETRAKTQQFNDYKKPKRINDLDLSSTQTGGSSTENTFGVTYWDSVLAQKKLQEQTKSKAHIITTRRPEEFKKSPKAAAFEPFKLQSNTDEKIPEESQELQETASFVHNSRNSIFGTTNVYPNHRTTYSDIKNPRYYHDKQQRTLPDKPFYGTFNKPLTTIPITTPASSPQTAASTIFSTSTVPPTASDFTTSYSTIVPSRTTTEGPTTTDLSTTTAFSTFSTNADDAQTTTKFLLTTGKYSLFTKISTQETPVSHDNVEVPDARVLPLQIVESQYSLPSTSNSYGQDLTSTTIEAFTSPSLTTDSTSSTPPQKSLTTLENIQTLITTLRQVNSTIDRKTLSDILQRLGIVAQFTNNSFPVTLQHISSTTPISSRVTNCTKVSIPAKATTQPITIKTTTNIPTPFSTIETTTSVQEPLSVTKSTSSFPTAEQPKPFALAATNVPFLLYKTSAPGPFSTTLRDLTTTPNVYPTTVSTNSTISKDGEFPNIPEDDEINNMIDMLMDFIKEDYSDNAEDTTPRPGLIIPPSAGPRTLHSLAIYFANALDNTTLSNSSIALNKSTSNEESYNVIKSLLSEMTNHRYEKLFKNNSQTTTESATTELGHAETTYYSEKPPIRQLARIFTQALSNYLEDPESFRKLLRQARPKEPELVTARNRDETFSLPVAAKAEEIEDDEVLNYSDTDLKLNQPQLKTRPTDNTPTPIWSTTQAITSTEPTESTTLEELSTTVSNRPTWGYILALNNSNFDNTNTLTNENENLQGADSLSFVSQYNKISNSVTNILPTGGESKSAQLTEEVYEKNESLKNHWTSSARVAKFFQNTLAINPLSLNQDFHEPESVSTEPSVASSEELDDSNQYSEIQYELRSLPKLELNSTQVHGILIDFMKQNRSKGSEKLERILHKLNITEAEFLTKMKEIESNPLTKRLILLLISECKHVKKHDTEEDTELDNVTLRTSRLRALEKTKSSNQFKHIIHSSLNDEDEDTRALQLLNSLYVIASKFGKNSFNIPSIVLNEAMILVVFC